MMLDLENLPHPIAVFAPHPDDETLGCGGLIAMACRMEIDIHAIFVTDGGASHPGSRTWSRAALAEIRMKEAEEALEALGAATCPRSFLQLPDGEMPSPGSAAYNEAARQIRTILEEEQSGTLVLPWRRDPHADHRRTWTLARDGANGLGRPFVVLEYPIWLEENGTDEDWPCVGEVDQRVLDIEPVRPMKEAAIAAHRSQLGELIHDDPTGFALSHATLERLVTNSERFWLSSW